MDHSRIYAEMLPVQVVSLYTHLFRHSSCLVERILDMNT